MDNYRYYFLPGLKGVLRLYPIKSLIKEWLFILSLILSLIISFFILFSDSDSFIQHLNLVLSFSIDIIPALIGLSLAGLAVFMSQGDRDVMEKITDLSFSNTAGTKYSYYQKVNAAFSITILAQLISLVVCIIISVAEPLTLLIPVNSILASCINFLVYFCCFFLLIYSILSIVDIISAIFSAGQVINFLFFKDKISNNTNTDTNKREP